MVVVMCACVSLCKDEEDIDFKLICSVYLAHWTQASSPGELDVELYVLEDQQQSCLLSPPRHQHACAC